MKEEIIKQRISTIKHWRHQIPLTDGSVTPGFIDTAKEWSILDPPTKFNGLRILDIGCSDGYYAFRSEQQGAKEVIAIDDQSSLFFTQGQSIEMIKDILGSKIIFRPISVYDLNVDEIGEFDIIFFLNVMYHLRHPLLALEKIRSVMKPGSIVFYKSYFSSNIEFKLFGKQVKLQLGSKPLCRYYPMNELAGDYTNWWGPNIPAHHAMLESSGFSIDKELHRSYDRIYYKLSSNESNIKSL